MRSITKRMPALRATSEAPFNQIVADFIVEFKKSQMQLGDDDVLVVARVSDDGPLLTSAQQIAADRVAPQSPQRT